MDSSCRILPSIQLTYISSTVSLMCKGLCLSRDFSGLVESEHEYNRVWIKQICVLNCSHHIPDWTFHLWLKYCSNMVNHWLAVQLDVREQTASQARALCDETLYRNGAWQSVFQWLQPSFKPLQWPKPNALFIQVTDVPVSVWLQWTWLGHLFVCK